MNPIIKEDIRGIIEQNVGLIDWKRFYGRTVLVTGANGMLPAYLVFTLLELNKNVEHAPVHVIGLVRNIEKAKAKFGEYMHDENLELFVQDVAESIRIEKPIDFIIHAASQASPKYYRVDPVGTINANVLGTINTLELARTKRLEGYLFLSSGAIYGVVDEKEFPVTENKYGYLDLLKVQSCYAESKRMGENLCVSYREQYGVNTKIVRVFHTYGPGLLLDDGRVFGDFCRSIINGDNIVLHSRGDAMRPFCYITDAVVAMFKILLDGECAAYNMANMDAEISIRDLAELLVSLYPEKNLSVVLDLGDKSEASIMRSPKMRLVADCTSLKALGWQPTVSIKEGFKRTIKSLSE